MELAADLKARGLVENSSADLDKILGQNRTVYLGIDPSADSMQAGNLLVVLLMKRLQDAGHTVQFIVGGGTGMIGDPREKGERPLADERTIAQNKRMLTGQLQRIMGRSVKIIDNADWLLKVKLVDFLRDIGKHFTVNELVKRDIIRRRLENEDDSISYTEFAYSLLQGYDYLVLNKKYGTDLQVGASDQWTNILSGVELIRRKEGKEAFALVTPLVTDANGKKFGKSEGNAVWLDPEKTSPYAFYQFWLNQPDAMVGTYLKYYTFLQPLEIDMLMELHERGPGKREAQKTLAREVTTIVHGKDAADRCVTVSQALFGERQLDSLTSEEVAVICNEIPVVKLASFKDQSLVDLLVDGGLASSKSEARRLIQARGVSVNDTILDDPDQSFSIPLAENGLALLRRGKQIAALVKK